MTAHRYWRLSFPSTGGSNTEITELQLRTVIGGASVASGGAASYGGPLVSGSAANAFDGNTGTVFAINSFGGWLAYDFGPGNAKDIVEIAITNGTTPSFGIIQGSFDYSDDAVRWFPRLAFANQTGWTALSTRVFTAQWDAPGNSRALPLPNLRLDVPRPPVAPTLTSVTPGAASPRSIDALDGGVYRISGTVKTKGTPDAPVKRMVYLFDHASWRVVRAQWSDPVTGAYSFDKIRTGKFFVVAFDYLKDYRAVIADNLTPKPMP
jgi:hypothetical protein